MNSALFALLWAVAVLAWTLTWLVRHIALSKGLLDIPNSRSSHSTPVPRGGGMAIVIASTLGFFAIYGLGAVDLHLLLALVFGAVPIAAIGFLDDMQPIRPLYRFGVHVVAAIFVTSILGGIPAMQVGDSVTQLGLIGNVLCVIALVWTLNLFNFMDGIDGIAASEAVFVCVAGSILTGVDLVTGGGGAAGLIVAAASCGFLLWNFPPAKIFMGDVGSGYLGFVIAVLALACARVNSVAIYQWWILGGVFFVDATVTLVRRVLRGEKGSVAHRSHAYQWLSRRWGGHRRVTLTAQAINFGWLLPMAWLCQTYQRYAIVVVGLALGPLILLCLIAGAGRAESDRSEL